MSPTLRTLSVTARAAVAPGRHDGTGPCSPCISWPFPLSPQALPPVHGSLTLHGQPVFVLLAHNACFCLLAL